MKQEHTRPLDDYERRYMDGDRALARERVKMAWWGHAIFAVAFSAATLEASAPGAAIALLLWLLLMSLRTTVTRQFVHIQLGLLGPRIPIENVTKAEVAAGSWLRMGWGVRFGLDGSITYSVPSSARDYVRIVYRQGGHKRVVRVTSADPARLVSAIEAAQTLGVSSNGIRVARTVLVESTPAEGSESEEGQSGKSGRGARK